MPYINDIAGNERELIASNGAAAGTMTAQERDLLLDLLISSQQRLISPAGLPAQRQVRR